MKVLFNNFYDSLNTDNKLFENRNSAIGDDLLKPFNILADVFSKNNIEIGTYSKISPEEADAYVFIDYPKSNNPIFEFAKRNKKAKLYLLILESPIVNHNNFDLKLHDIFHKVFTWSDDLIDLDPIKYKKINYSFEIPTSLSNTERKKLCTVISGNKLSNQPDELYHERLKCIKWYEKNAPDQFDLYGTNWKIVKFPNETFSGKLLNKINRRYKLLKYSLSVYKGTVERKSDVLPLYKFCLCFENVANQRGYITEKIFDCLFSGTIPIYKGANNIQDYIPQSCFIDYNKFKNMKELHEFISTLPDVEIQKYQKNILNYLQSTQIQQFSINEFCDTLLKNIH